MKALICSTTAFAGGPPARMAEGLRRAGWEAEQVAMPLSARSPERVADSMLLWRSVDLTEADGQAIDLVVATDFPSYMVAHPRVVIWLPSLFGPNYDIGGGARGLPARNLILSAESERFSAAAALFAASDEAAQQLGGALGLQATVLPYPDGSGPTGLWDDAIAALANAAGMHP